MEGQKSVTPLQKSGLLWVIMFEWFILIHCFRDHIIG